MDQWWSFALGDKNQPERSFVFVLAVCFATNAWALDQRRLAEVADRQNQSLPAMVAKELRQEKVQLNGSSFTYRYTHLGMSAARLRELRLEVTQRPYIFPRICQEADTGRMLREGVSFRYVYAGNDGGVGGELLISPSDCR